MHYYKQRKITVEFLKEINSPIFTKNAYALKSLDGMFKYLLIAFIHENDQNYKFIYAI